MVSKSGRSNYEADVNYLMIFRKNSNSVFQ